MYKTPPTFLSKIKKYKCGLASVGGKGSKHCRIALIPAFPFTCFCSLLSLLLYKTTLNFLSKDFKQKYSLIHRKIWHTPKMNWFAVHLGGRSCWGGARTVHFMFFSGSWWPLNMSIHYLRKTVRNICFIFQERRRSIFVKAMPYLNKGHPPKAISATKICWGFRIRFTVILLQPAWNPEDCVCFFGGDPAKSRGGPFPFFFLPF